MKRSGSTGKSLIHWRTDSGRCCAMGLREYFSEPTHHHFDDSGYRRFNLKRFPYNVLFEDLEDRVRVVVVRHNSTIAIGIGRQALLTDELSKHVAVGPGAAALST